MRSHLRSVVVVLSAAALACGGAEPAPAAPPSPTPKAELAPTVGSTPARREPRDAYPPTAKRPETITIGSASFADDHAWLRNASNPEVDAWVDAQNAHATSVIGPYPHLDELRARFQELTRRSKPTLYAIKSTSAGFFALRRAPSAPQAALVVVPSLDAPSSARTVVDPVSVDPSGQTSIDWFAVAPNGKYVAVSLSKNGSEDGSLSVFDAASGKLVDGPIPRVQYPSAGGSAAFAGDGKQLFYTRYPAPGERPDAELHAYQQLYRHTVGAKIDTDERVALELPAIAEIKLDAASESGTVVAAVNIGDGGDRLWFLGQRAGGRYTWARFAEASDGVSDVELAGDDVYVLSRKEDLRGAVLRMPVKGAHLADAKVVVAPSDRELTNIKVAADLLVALDIANGATRARAFDRAGRLRGDVKLPARASVEGTTVGRDGTLYLNVRSYTSPAALYALATPTLALRKTAVFAEAPVQFDDLEVTDEVAISRDGTRVPLTILARRGTPRRSDVPALLTGYGGYGLGMTPSFDARRRVWLDQGGILAIAHLRGGNDKGEAWHRAGKLAKKQNVFDDFIACAERLVAAGYTSTAKLAISGRSNGGLLMAAILAQRPDLVRAAVVGVPIADMARFEEVPNGLFNTSEFGSIHDPAMAPALLAYSPLQNLKPASYPSVFVISGKTDGRVNPADARELAAKLQDLSTSEHPILLRTWMDSGHGMGTNVFKRAEEEAQTYAFLFRELGVDYHAPANEPPPNAK